MGHIQQGLQPMALPLWGKTPIYSSGSESINNYIVEGIVRFMVGLSMSKHTSKVVLKNLPAYYSPNH